MANTTPEDRSDQRDVLCGLVRGLCLYSLGGCILVHGNKFVSVGALHKGPFAIESCQAVAVLVFWLWIALIGPTPELPVAAFVVEAGGCTCQCRIGERALGSVPRHLIILFIPKIIFRVLRHLPVAV